MDFKTSIKTLNFFEFQKNLNNRKNIFQLIDGKTPLEYLFENFNETDNYSIAILMSQSLINNGADFKTFLKNYSNSTHKSNKKRLFDHITKTKKYDSEHESENNVSDYSKQEHLHLKNYARKFKINDDDKHLALRIIKFLEKTKQCPSCSFNE